MVLVKKWPFFHFFFFLGNIGQENVFYNILERKNAFLGHKKKKFKKSKNWDFSKGVNPWFWSKNGHFFHFFLFLGTIGQENVFYNILESLSFYLEYQLKYISRLIFFEKQTMEKFIIFDQNRGLTPLEKFKICNIWPKSWSWKFNFLSIF